MFGSEENEDHGGASQLEIDEEMTLLERVKAYCESSVSVQRLVHVRELAACAEEIGAVEAVKDLVPLLRIVATDPEQAIRQVMAPLVPTAFWIPLQKRHPPSPTRPRVCAPLALVTAEG